MHYTTSTDRLNVGHTKLQCNKQNRQHYFSVLWLLLGHAKNFEYSEVRKCCNNRKTFCQWMSCLICHTGSVYNFYRAMHFSAKRGIAIACRLSVRPSVRPSVTLVNCDHIGWNSSKIISQLVSLGCSLFATPTWRVYSKGFHPSGGVKQGRGSYTASRGYVSDCWAFLFYFMINISVVRFLSWTGSEHCEQQTQLIIIVWAV